MQNKLRSTDKTIVKQPAIAVIHTPSQTQSSYRITRPSHTTPWMPCAPQRLVFSLPVRLHLVTGAGQSSRTPADLFIASITIFLCWGSEVGLSAPGILCREMQQIVGLDSSQTLYRLSNRNGFMPKKAVH